MSFIAESCLLFPKAVLRLCPNGHGPSLVGWDQDFALPRASEAEPWNDQRDCQRLLGGETSCVSPDDGDKYDRSYKIIKSSLVIQHSALIAKHKVQLKEVSVVLQVSKQILLLKHI